MAYADVVDVIPGQLEAVKTDLEKVFEQTDQIAARVKKSSKVQKVSRYLWRLPMKLYAGGNFSKYSGNNAATGSPSGLGFGTGMKLSALEAAYYYSSLAFRITQEQIDTSSDSSQSVVNVLSDTLANAMVEAGVLDDIEFHTNGSGILTNGCSTVAAGPPATMTFAAVGDNLGISRLREGMSVDIWNSSGTFSAGVSPRPAAAAGTPIIIVGIDYDNKIVTLNQGVTGLTAGDILVFQGMGVYGPSNLTSFSAGYPGTPGALTGAGVSGGIGGDSFRHGFPYMTDTTSSNYFYGKQKSAIPQLMPARVNAQSAPLEWDHGQRLIAKMIQRRDNDTWKGVTGIAPTSQRAAVFNLGIAISNKLITGTEFGSSVDLMPSNMGYEETFNFANIPCILSKRQDRSRIDFINFEKIGRAQLFDTKFFDLGGTTMYVGRGTDGSVQPFVEFFIVQAYDYVAFDSGSFGVIDSLALPANWDA